MIALFNLFKPSDLALAISMYGLGYSIDEPVRVGCQCLYIVHSVGYLRNLKMFYVNYFKIYFAHNEHITI